MIRFRTALPIPIPFGRIPSSSHTRTLRHLFVPLNHGHYPFCCISVSLLLLFHAPRGNGK